MTQEEIIKLAREVGYPLVEYEGTPYIPHLLAVLLKAAATPQRPWVGLTKEEIAEFDTWHDTREEEVGWCNPSEIVAYIEAKLKQKNGYAKEKNT